MPNVSSFGAQTDNAVVSGTVTDRQMVIPEVPPQGLMSIGPRQSPNYIKEPWNAQTSYVFYDVVKDGAGASYVATKPAVPAGTALTNEDYWFKWADPNAQINELNEVVKTFNERIAQNASAITAEVARATAAEQTEEQRATAAEATKAPINHASEETIYGIGNELNYGHVKLAADDTPMTSGANDGIAATPKMVETAINRTRKSILQLSSEYIGTFKSATAGLQGGCIVDNAYICFSENNLYSFNINTGNLLNSKSNIDLGHGNSLTYNAKTKKIYAYGNFTDSTVYVINPATLEIESTFLLSDKTETNFTINAWGYALVYVPLSDCFYAFGATNTKEQSLVLKFDGAFNYITQFVNPKIGINILGACAAPNTDHLIAFYSGPKSLVEFDSQMNVIGTYSIENLASGCVHIHEIESMCAYNNDLMFLFKSSRSANYQLAKISASHSNVDLGDEFIENICSCYVNNAYTGFVANGSKSTPFNDINDAISLGFDFEQTVINDESTNAIQKTADFNNVKNNIILNTNDTVPYMLKNIGCDLTVNEINLVSMHCAYSPSTRITSNTCVESPKIECFRSTVYMNGKTAEKINLAQSSFNGNTNVSFADLFRLKNQSIVSDAPTNANVAYIHGVYANGSDPNTLNNKYIPTGPGVLTLTVNGKQQSRSVVGIGADFDGVTVTFERTNSWLQVKMNTTAGVTNWDYQKL